VSSEIKIIDSTSGTTIYTYSLSNQNVAFQKAKELEEMGIEVTIKSPTSIETLGVALGMDHQALEKISCEIDKEIESHQ
tara:strand:+ start:327 stop:563 length:237 start_codon:yes stop_codon:yes gene_type:complete